jgi:predicted secreted Zn-dependent protease
MAQKRASHEKKVKQRKSKKNNTAKHSVNGLTNLANLQDQIGNQAVQRMLARGSVTKATIQQIQCQLEEAEALQTRTNDGEVKILPAQYEYYDVSGSILTEVAQQLDPEEWGRCTYTYTYNYETTNGQTTKVDLELALTIRLPRWQGAGWDKASLRAKQEWERMIQALLNHEEAHAAIARQWAPRFKERLLRQAESKVRTRFEQTCNAVDKETKQFDQRTQHGQAMGVTLDTSIP